MGKKSKKSKAKITKKQIATEKRIAKLQRQEKTLMKQSSVLGKRVERERAKGQREIDALDRQIEKLDRKRDAVYGRALPSQKAANRIEDKLLKVRNQLQDLQVIPEPPPSDAKRRDPDEQE